MYLRDLSVHAADLAEMPPGRTRREFNLTSHPPVEAYLDLLPRRKVMLDNLAKVNLAIGPRPAGSKPYFAAMNVAIMYRPRFDFVRYFELSRSEQQLKIAEVLHKALLRIARRTNSDEKWFHAAYSALREMPFPLPDISEYELRRRFSSVATKEIQAEKRRVKNGGRTSRRS